jgi:hypothetical protein
MRFQDLLLIPGVPTPGPRITVAAGEDDLERRAQLLTAHFSAGATFAVGAGVEGPVDTAWFTRDLIVTDRDGYVLVISAARQADIAAAPEWTEMVRRSVVPHDGSAATTPKSGER